MHRIIRVVNITTSSFQNTPLKPGRVMMQVGGGWTSTVTPATHFQTTLLFLIIGYCSVQMLTLMQVSIHNGLMLSIFIVVLFYLVH